jgi:hypothetical protein
MLKGFEIHCRAIITGRFALTNKAKKKTTSI